MEIFLTWDPLLVNIDVYFAADFNAAQFLPYPVNIFVLECFFFFAFLHLFSLYKKFETIKTIRLPLLKLLPARLSQHFNLKVFHCLINPTKKESSPICRVSWLVFVSPIILHGYLIAIGLRVYSSSSFPLKFCLKCFVHSVTAFVMGELFLCIGFVKYMSSSQSHSLALILWILVFNWLH